MDDRTIARLYIDATNRQKEVEDGQSKLVHDNVVAYDRYWDMAAKMSSEVARSHLPKEAAVVDKIEAGVLTVKEARNARWDALNACLIEKMQTVAKQPVDRLQGDAQLMIEALQEVGRFRIEHLDGVDSKLVMLVEHGVGFQPKDKDRLLNRLIATWAKGYGISLKELKPKVEEVVRSVQIDPTHQTQLPRIFP